MLLCPGGWSVLIHLPFVLTEAGLMGQMGVRVRGSASLLSDRQECRCEGLHGRVIGIIVTLTGPRRVFLSSLNLLDLHNICPLQHNLSHSVQTFPFL
jgi:hypothetical protein